MEAALQWLRQRRAGPLAITALHAVALAVFVHGFLLTRLHMEQRSSAAPPAPAPRTKLVWLMIDSLRYDFVVADGRYSCYPGKPCHQGRMAYLANLTSQAEGARAFRFVADPPTTTTQRLKSLMTGGLPSFFDVSSSFSAGRLEEDNLVDQLHGAGRRLAFLGDTTWAQLFPTQFTRAEAFPCFNVKDLHTVDNGIWEHLLPALWEPEGWDVLVAHYLGVDHAGHAHGVGSEEMAAKLRQMDDHVRAVVEEMVEGAGPGGPFERALVLVSGDHGQTLSGDHGGGSPEEVDSALVAIDPSVLHRLRQNSSTGASDSKKEREGRLSMQQAGEGALWGAAPCRRNCSCGPDANQCATDLPQVDLTPTLAVLVGVPIPFGNLGKLSAELWGFAAAGAGTKRGARAAKRGGSDAALAAVLRANVQQVHTYLNTYASSPGATFSAAALQRINRMYDELGLQGATSADLATQNARYLAFLEAAAAVAREQWTQFRDLSMLAGLALLAATLCLHAAAAFGPDVPALPKPTARPTASNSRTRQHFSGVASRVAASVGAALEEAGLIRRQVQGAWPQPTVAGALAALVGVHVLGIFSFFFLLSEGSKVCYIVGAMSAVLAAAAARQPGRRGQVLRLSLLLLGSNAAMAALGLANHSGLAFWHRLTVHPEPATGEGLTAAAAGAADAEPPIWQWSPRALLAGASRLSQLGDEQFWAVARHSVLCMLPIACLAAAAIQLPGQLKQRADGWLALRLQRCLLAAAFASVVAFHRMEQLVQLGLAEKDATAEQLMQQRAACAGEQPRPSTQFWSPLWMAAATIVARLPGTSWLAALAGSGGWQQMQSVPLRLLLPQLTYSLCIACLLPWAVQQAQRRWLQGRRLHRQRLVAPGSSCSSEAAQNRQQKPAQPAGAGQQDAVELAGVAEAAAGLQGPLLAALLQVSDSTTPLLMLLGAVQLWALARVLHTHAQRAGRSAGVGMAAAAVLAVMQAQMFFTTGHLCEFAGLQYLAGFVGYDEFHLLRSAALLVIHTFGAMLLVALALPVVLHFLQPTSPAVAEDGSAPHKQGQARPPPEAAGWRRAVLVFLFVRSCTAFAATVSAAVQRRHLYAWSLFAPKFAFELVFLLGTDALLSLVCLLL